MAGYLGPVLVVNPGATGTATSGGVKTSPNASKAAVVLVIEAVGATPTISIKVQGSLTPDDVSDANALWFDMAFMLAGSGAAAAPVEQSNVMTQTAVGAWPMFLSVAHTRFARRLRVVTSANTNVTYRVELHQQFTN